MLFLGIGVLQAVLLGIVGQFGLGLPINHVFGFYSAVILASVTFVAIIQFLMMYLGDIGKILSMALMVLQLTSTGGTFPIETSGAFFEVLNKIMPMTYSVNLLKEVISGGDAGIIWYNVGILFAFFAVFTAVTFGLSIYQNKKDKKKKEIEHIDIDTDVTEMTV
ncbi:MAG: YhgE/Pip family protein [Acutalibacteraceae bacterium]